MTNSSEHETERQSGLGGPRRRLKAAERRKSILAAAEEVFGEHGYEQVRIDDVANAAGISKALIYEHFDSKKDLYIELMNNAASDLIQRMLAAAGGETLESIERLENGAIAVFDFVKERPDSFHMFIRDVADPEIAEEQLALRRGAVEAMADVMEMTPREAQEGFERRNREQFSEMTVGAAYALAGWSLRNPDADRDELVWILMNFMWLGFERITRGERWRLSAVSSSDAIT